MEAKYIFFIYYQHRWRIVDSDTEQQSPNKSDNAEKLTNGSAEAEQQMEKVQQRKTPKAVTTATAASAAVSTTETAAATGTPTTTTSEAPATGTPTTTTTEAIATGTPTTTTEAPATGIPTTTTEAPTISTSTTPPATTKTTPKLNNNTEKKTLTKPATKLNGMKQSNKKKKRLSETVNLSKEQAQSALSNGLLNGKAEQLAIEAKEQQLKGKQTPINGKTKKHNNKIPVNNNVYKASIPVATPTPAAAAVNSKDAIAPITTDKPTDIAVEPPNKRPKLQIAQVTIEKTQVKPKEPATEAAVTPAVDIVQDDEEEEDTSDEAYIARHQRALIEERRRFETFLKFPWSTRSRANRRVDSRAESSGANTPDPASPAASQLTGPAADNESIPSPLAQTMLQHPLDAITGDAETTKRRRTTSSKLKDHERRSTTPDTREVSIAVFI